MNRSQVIETIEDTGVIAIMRHISGEALKPTVEALWKGGIRCIEVTANTEGALSMVSHLAEEYGDRMIIGAGTILDARTAREYIRAGACFLLSPSLHREVIDAAREKDIVSIPGAYTPTEIINGYSWGGDIIKLFPACIGGADYIRQIRGPFPQIPILAVGGVNLENTASFIQAGCMGVGIGSNLVNPNVIKNKDFQGMERTARAFVCRVKEGKRKDGMDRP
ncbi:MAG: bifunctional 4-hydroxy-2-oxoglutarate aldolase/2-dehydro-3-deoxy-phosphogluconate aldolase [Clostridia bacterium]|jgi:2-dehydro-3-deoxyphosphogluconate aldolase/(4S)-4-hydroxy-2-oxoglutarate aldolase